MTDSQNAFVILPFEDQFEELYHEKIVPILEDKGYTVNKADSVDSQRAIIEDIINGIEHADLIIADLTGTNPNVFYELGIAHGLGVPTVLITQDIDELPFDLSAYKTIEYSLMFNEIDEFVEELSEIGENHSAGSIEFGSPVSDYADVEINSSPSQQDSDDSSLPDISEESNEGVEEDDEVEKDVLDYVAETDDTISELNEIFEEITKKSKSFESDVWNHTQELDSLPSTKNNRKRTNKAAREMAESVSTYAEFLEERISPIDEKMDFLMDAVQSFIESTNLSQENHQEEIWDLYGDLDSFIQDVEDIQDDLNRFQDELSGMRGLSRELDHSIKQLKTVLSTFESILDEGIAKAERFKSLIENKLDRHNHFYIN